MYTLYYRSIYGTYEYLIIDAADDATAIEKVHAFMSKQWTCSCPDLIDRNGRPVSL